MKYTKDERLDNAKRIYDHEMTVEEAAPKYDLNPSSIEEDLRGSHVQLFLQQLDLL